MFRYVRLLACALACAACAQPAIAQRLPDTVVPTHYTLTFTPDLATATFTGEAEIIVRVTQPTSTIVLNALELTIHESTVAQGATSAAANVTYDKEAQQVTLQLQRPLADGEARIRTRFAGTLNDTLVGLYLSQTSKRRYAVTQFEATDARRAFPCFDEPAFKATFDITIVADEGDVAISNGRVLRDVPGPGEGKHTVTFATTKRMSTYLVALLVGDFECLEGEAAGVPLRVCATPGHKASLPYAMEATKAILTFFDGYYSIKYPFEKLDQIAVPDFMAGAMENTGAIIYRETELLLDEATATPEGRRRIADVIAHEIAHQWFGNIVTMAWWNDIWLNEGFATWITAKPVAAWKPEWNMPLRAVQDTARALSEDAVASTRPIRAPEARTPEEIQQLFDGITYGKTAAVLRMIEQYLGEEAFRTAVNGYLERHAYANATAEDFWNALKGASGKPVDAVMRSFVTQPGAPLLTVAATCTAGRQQVTVTQGRFFSDPARMRAGSAERWQVPVCFRAAGGEPRCELLSERQQVFSLDACGPWLVANADGRGYYRTEYAPELAGRLASALPQLSPAERLVFLSDQLALVSAERETFAGYLRMLPALGVESAVPVAQVAFRPLRGIADELIAEADRAAFGAWAAGIVRPQLDAVGREPRPAESEDVRTLRALALGLMASVARDQPTISYLTELAARFIAEPASVDSSLVNAALDAAVWNGDAALYERILAALERATDPLVHEKLEGALARFRQPALLERTLERALTPAVRSQDLMTVLYNALAAPETRPLVWAFVKKHFDTIQGRLGSLASTAIVGLPNAFCDAGLREDARRFFGEHPVPGAETTLAQSLERADTCIRMRTREAPILSGWLRESATADSKQ